MTVVDVRGVIRRYELTDVDWESLSPRLPWVVAGG
jgi:hypothetical protein